MAGLRVGHAMCVFRKLLLVVSSALLVLLSIAAAEQPLKPINAPSVKPPGATVNHLINKSGYVFAGTVQAVMHISPTEATGIGSTEITFHVDRAIRGVENGQKLTVREWAGLWRSGEHYRVGERLLLFLYPPSKLGFTSPVGGPSGRFIVDQGLRIVVEPKPTSPATAVNAGQDVKVVTLGDFVRMLDGKDK